MTWLRLHKVDLALALVGLALGLTGGLLADRGGRTTFLFVAGCLVLAVVVTRPALFGVLAVVGCFAVQRLGAGGGASTGVSYSDALMAGAMALAVPSLAIGPEARRLRLALAGLCVYLVCLLPSVISDPSTRGWFEWGHRLVLVGGALLVGAWLVRERLAQPALRLLVLAACGVGALAMVHSLQHGLAPASPLGMHKNFVGAQLSIVLVMLITAPREILNLGSGARAAAIALIAGGLLASQSRGAMLAAAVGIVFVIAFSLRSQTRQSRGLVVLVSLGLAAFVYFSISSDLNQSEDDRQNNSIGQRQKVEARTLEIWRTSPVTGVGLKYFNSGEWGPLAQPANIVVDNELAESGVVGLAGFIVLQVGAISSGLRRRREPFVIVGTACVTAALVHGMVDIYWTAATVPLPFLILGMALGAAGVAQTPADEPKTRESALSSI